MEAKLSDLSGDETFDACVIGGGPAGISLANKLSSLGKRTLLLEAGDSDFSDQSQDTYKGKVVGDAYFDLDAARMRFLGGTSNHWGGWCRHMDKADFEVKAGLQHTAWPISIKELEPYYVETEQILDLSKRTSDEPIAQTGLNKIGFVYSPPVYFKEKFGEALKNDPNIVLVKNANFVGFDVEGSRVTLVSIRDYGDTSRKLAASTFVLATGGIENSRLLLFADIAADGQLLKGNKNVGRYWMEHPHANIGNAILSRDLPFKSDQNGIIYFSPTAEAMAEHGILNCGIRVMPDHMEGAKKQIADLACVAPDLATWVAKMFDRNLFCGARIRAAWEQEPRFENHVALGEEKDRFGIPRPVLYWKKSELDFKTPRITAELLGKYLAAKDFGRMRVMDWVIGKAAFPDDDEIAGYHHMGGTRMAASAETGVVDSNCKVFGQDNLYVAGSSVFPSGGHANPTLTLVQLALRLGDHLGRTS